MQEKVVYFLGAGFSQPMGLPVMSDFLIRSKDLFLSEPDKFPHFEEVFKTITEMHSAKSHYNVNLLNIEEILSLLEMKYYVTGSGERERFIEYLKDTIEAFTPSLPTLEKLFPPSSLLNYLFHVSNWREYCFFVASLFNLVIRRDVRKDQPPLELEKQDEPSAQYSVISLNYDMVLEKCLDLILRQCDTKSEISFARTCKEAEVPGCVPLAKLHGSVNGTIVPPTWNKVARPEEREIQEGWQLAYKALSEATQIRILGYSLPQTDAYVRYLFESATMEEPHRKNLKNIDVICLDDPDGSVKRRYEEFLCFDRWCFSQVEIGRYLSVNRDRVRPEVGAHQNEEVLRFNRLEGAHEHLMEKPHR